MNKSEDQEMDTDELSEEEIQLFANGNVVKNNKN